MASGVQELARRFEQFVEDILTETFECNGCSVQSTRRPNPFVTQVVAYDGGRDFELATGTLVPDGLFLFGMPIKPNSRYAIEVKFTATPKGQIEFDRVAPNLAPLQPHPHAAESPLFHGVALVTNGCMSPSVHWTTTSSLGRFRDGIAIVDGLNLRAFAAGGRVPWPEDIRCYGPTRPLADGVAFDRFVEPWGPSGFVNLFFTLYNRTREPKPVELRVQTDGQWQVIDGVHLDRTTVPLDAFHRARPGGVPPDTLPPLSSRSYRLCASPSYGALPDIRKRDLLKTLSRLEILGASGRRIRRLLSSSLPSVQIVYRPPFVGSGNKMLKDSLLRELHGFPEDPGSRGIILITGAAGVGKSRIIEEALEGCRGRGSLTFARYTVDADGHPQDRALSALRETLSALYSVGRAPDWLAASEGIEDILKHLDAETAETPGRRGSKSLVLVLEDVHNASEALCEVLRCWRRRQKDATRVLLVLSTRNDDTFNNRFYSKLEAELKGAGIPIRTVEPLKADEAAGLISTLIEGIDETSTARILGLSSSVPHNIVQCIEYLLDASLISVVSRGTLSITHPAKFQDRLSDLPASMKRLYAERFRLLGTWEHGQAAQQALLAATFFGTHPPDLVCSLAGDAAVARTVLDELAHRRFFVRTEPGGQAGRTHESSPTGVLEWGHESILLFFRNLLRNHVQELAEPAPLAALAADFSATARLLHGCDPLFTRLSPLSQGAVAVLAEDHGLAFDRFATMLEQVARLRNFSTIRIKTDYFDSIDYAIRLLRNSAEPDSGLLARLILAKAYIGAFHKSLPYAQQADRFGKHLLQSRCLTNTDHHWCDFWLDTLIAHVLMDAGQVGEALFRYQKLQLRIRLVPEVREDNRLVFEIHNALRLLYTYANFQTLAELHGSLADQAAREADAETGDGGTPASGAQELIGMGLGDEALRLFLCKPKECLDLNRRSFRINCRGGTPRHRWHGIASLIACKLSERNHDRKWLACQNSVIEQLMKTCRNDGYESILPRLYLLRSTIVYLQGAAYSTPGHRDAAAEEFFHNALAHSRDGLEACVSHAIGYIQWQLRNLNAAVQRRLGDDAMAAKELRSALESIKGEGLFFMGDEAVISPVPIIIANCIKAQIVPDASLMVTMQELHGFHPYKWGDVESFSEIKISANRKHHIIRSIKETPKNLIVDAVTKMAVVCWF